MLRICILIMCELIDHKSKIVYPPETHSRIFVF
uniref:Uncharacterized protein n=1 Tax=Anguilla anguilla TaxID=7936 RepID=A0A0E9R5V0_ANGAN